ncbi:hypothetical protein HK097_005315, partial [Rhizophlyctis rosea]
FLSKRLPDSSKITFLTPSSKYLSSDKFGVTSAYSEAISPAEEWDVVIRDDGVALQNVLNGKYLRCEMDGTARCDSEEVGFREVFRILCQAQNKARAKKRKEKESVDAEVLEVETIKKFHSWGGGRLVNTTEDTRELKRARKDGQLNEALLDRRSKLKADRYCK